MLKRIYIFCFLYIFLYFSLVLYFLGIFVCFYWNSLDRKKRTEVICMVIVVYGIDIDTLLLLSIIYIM